VFEFEVNHARYPASHLPPGILQQFGDAQEGIVDISLLPWEEHCTECAMPECYKSCDLYAPRKDGHCRRFVNGIEVVEGVPNSLGYAVRVSFKRWGRLMCFANLHLVPIQKAKTVLKYHIRLSQWISKLPDGKLKIRGRRGVLSRLARRAKMRIFGSGMFAEECGTPDRFLCQIYNPGSISVQITLSLRANEEPRRSMPYQRLVAVPPGFLRVSIPYGELAPHLDLGKMFTIAIGPSIDAPEQEGLVLYFGVMAFVKVSRAPAVAGPSGSDKFASDKVKTVKVVAWDLDNTLWDGILTEDGPEGVRLREDIASLIRELDRRGIVNSIVSKNDFQSAWNRVQEFGLDAYFVYPRISWEPKGESVKSLIQDFNVGADTVVFVDDSSFERFEVQSTNPGVRVVDVAECGDILELPEFNPPRSAESAQRRQFYQNEERRRQFQTDTSGEYREFLRRCEIKVRVSNVESASISRAHELIQRTNQLNFSGNRYSREQIEGIVANPALSALCIFAGDRFGDYGMVGFCIIDEAQEHPRLIDLMFSCRIQAKRVEHAFLTRLLEAYRRKGATRFEAIYRKSAHNAQAGRVFEDLQFACASQMGDTYTYTQDLTVDIPEEEIIAVEWQTRPISS
jgi:FkbH-like protein